MILTCPECATSYFVDDARIPAGGRSVKCSSCDARWMAMPEAPAEEPRPAKAPSAPFHADEDYADDLEVVGPSEVASPPPAPPATKAKPPRAARETGGKVTVWIAAAVAVALVVTAAIVFRGAVVRALPGAQTAYAGIGVPVNALGLAIEDVKAQPTFEAGRPVLAVSGAIRNERDTGAVAPSLRISLLDRAGKPVAAKIAKPTDPLIPGHATRHFAITIVDPPASGHDLEVKFEPAAAGPAAASSPAVAATVPTLTPAPQEAKPMPAAAPDASPGRV